MERCIFCQDLLDPATRLCRRCGRAQPFPIPNAAVSAPASGQPTKHCTKCGDKLPLSARFCGRCGQAQPPLPQNQPEQRHSLIGLGIGETALPHLPVVSSALAGPQVGSIGLPSASALPQSGAASIPSLAAGPQTGAPGIPTIPAGTPASFPATVPTLPAGPQTGAPGVPTLPAGPQTGLPARQVPGSLRTVGKGARRSLRAKMLGTTVAKIITILVAATVVTTGTAAALVATGTKISLPFFGSSASALHPVLTVQSKYHEGALPAGSATTTLQVSGRSFAARSAVTFLLNGKAIPGAQQAQSDAQGQVQTTLTITPDWPLGTEKLTAKDAQGNVAESGATVAIVPQGEAHTLGLNGAPPDDASFQIMTNTGAFLIVTGHPDPAGGTVCRTIDDGQLHTYSNANGDVTQEATSCTGTYKGGKLVYDETLLSHQSKSPNFDGTGFITCVSNSTPYIEFHLEGTFTSPTTISGTAQSIDRGFTCIDGSTSAGGSRTGPWKGTVTGTP